MLSLSHEPKHVPYRKDLVNRLFHTVNRLFDTLEGCWESPKTRKRIATLLVVTFGAALIVIELNRQGVFPSVIGELLPRNHFYAVSLVFTLILAIEISALVFGLAHSVADAAGKQFEILSLILLRQSFKEFIYFSEPIAWAEVSSKIVSILMNMGGALLIFITLFFYYRIQRHHAIVMDGHEQSRFRSAKKLVSLFLLTVFILLGGYYLWCAISGHETASFFQTFYTVLIFSDIFIVLISLHYSTTYPVVFRNSAFALMTVVIRLALVAPPYINIALSVGAALFALVLTMVYNAFVGTEEENRSAIPTENRVKTNPILPKFNTG